MRRFLLAAALTLSSSAFAANILFDLSHFNANPATNRWVTLQWMSPFPGNLNNYTSSVAGTFWVSNASAGDIVGTIKQKGQASEIRFQVTISPDDTGSLFASNHTSVLGVQTYPSTGRSAWSISAADGRYARIGSGAATNVFFLDSASVDHATSGGSNVFYVTGTLTNSTTGNAATANAATTSTNIAGVVYLVRDGVQTRYANLEAAGTASQAFDASTGAGALNGTNNIRIKSGVTLDLTSATVTNWTTQVGTNGPLLVLSGNRPQIIGGSHWAAYRNVGSNDSTGFSYQAAIGVLESALGSSRLGYGGATNFVVDLVRVFGETDCFFVRSTNIVSGEIHNSFFDSRWDTVLLAEGAHRLVFQDCTFTAIGTNQASGNQGRSYAVSIDSATGSYTRWINCHFVVSNSLCAILNSELGGGATNEFINCSFTNLNASGTEDFIIDGANGDVVIFDNCTGVRPSHLADFSGDGSGYRFRSTVNGGLVFGGNALNGAGASIGVGATATVLPFTGNLTGNVAGATNANATTIFGSGTAPTARLGSGTANSSTFLRGDQTWATPGDVTQAGNNNLTGTNHFAGGFGVNNSYFKLSRDGWTNLFSSDLLVGLYTNAGVPRLYMSDGGLSEIEVSATNVTLSYFSSPTISLDGSSGMVNAYGYTVGGGGYSGLGSGITSSQGDYIAPTNAGAAGDFVIHTGSNRVKFGRDGSGLTNLNSANIIISTNTGSDVTIDFSLPYAFLATNNNLSLTGVSNKKTDSLNEALRAFTNSSAAAKTITMAATFNNMNPSEGNTLYLTNYGELLVTWTAYTGTNFYWKSR